MSMFGVWVAVRSDADAAANTCREIAREIVSWKARPRA
jgi:hypothetical protein